MATIKEIADKAGVSPSTVSIVLSGLSRQRKISKKTQEKVLEAARELEYTPNIMARRLRAGVSKRKVISMYQSADARAVVMVRFTQGIHDSIKEYQDPPLFYVSQYASGELVNEESLFQVSTCNGAIVCNTNIEDIRFLEENTPSFPIVLFNTECDGYSSVTIDDHSLGIEAVAIFNAQGCRRAAYLCDRVEYKSNTLRLNGFREACGVNNIELLPVIAQDASIQGGYIGAKKLLDMPERPDCVFFASELQAFGALRKFREAGVRVPEEMKIIAIGNSFVDFAEFSVPPISTFDIPIEDMASKCLQLLTDAIEGTGHVSNIQVPYNYVPRGTCGGMDV